MKSATRHLVYLLCVLISTQLGAQELEIKRAKQKITTIQEDGLPAGWKRLGDDLFRVRFLLPNFSDLMYRNHPEGTIDDPFSDDSGPGLKKQFTAQQALEELGIPFDELASASFDPATKILTVINNANGIEIVDVCIGSHIGQGQARTIAVRLEIYELTKLQALQVQQSAGPVRDHAPERAAALAAVRDGKAKLVSVVSLATTAGQRSKLADSIEFLYPGNKTPVAGADKKDSKETDGFNHEEVGTVLEVEPNVDADGQTIDLNLAIDHHTAPPDADIAGTPKLHHKSIVTNVRLIDGEYILIGNWTPTGKPEYANADLVQVAFITASIQRPEAYTEPGSIITDEEEGEVTE